MKNTLIKFFSIPAPKKVRVNPIIAKLKLAGYEVERDGREWEVWKRGDSSTVAVYNRLSDIPENAV